MYSVIQSDQAHKEGELLRLEAPLGERYDEEGFQQMLQRQAAIYGAESEEMLAALYENDGRTFMGGVTFLQYNGEWKIHNFWGGMLNISASSPVVPCTPEQYEAALKP